MSEPPSSQTPLQRVIALIELEIEQAARIGNVLSRPSEHTAGYMKGLRAAQSIAKDEAASQ